MFIHRSVLLLVALVIITPLLCGQDLQRLPSLSHGVNLVVGPLDQFSRSFGLQDDKIHDAARAGLESCGWKLNDASELMVSVTVTALPQRDEDKYPFRIEVHAGTSPEAASGNEDAPWVIADIPAVKSIDVAWNDHASIISAANRMAKSIAVKLKREVMRIRFNQKKSQYEESEPSMKYYNGNPNFEARNPKQYRILEIPNPKKLPNPAPEAHPPSAEKSRI